jgi:hypothetical protein
MTSAEFSEYLAELGVSLPSPILSAIVAKVEALDADLAAEYDPADVTLIKYYAGGIVALSSGSRQIKSQGAPNGASRSFYYGAQIGDMLASLAALDTAGITDALVAVTQSGFAEFTVSRA